MSVLIEVRTEAGTVRRCDASCHYAESDRSKCNCICGGKLHGIKSDAEHLSWEALHELRAEVALGEGESVQLRIGV